MDTALLVRRTLLVVTVATALTAVLGGLARVGISLAWGPAQATSHGPLFVLGVFGTVIALERAVALGHPAGFVAPAGFALTAVATLSGLPFAGWAAALASGALVGVNLAIVRRQAAPFTWLMVVGSLALSLGSLAWALGRAVSEVVPGWTAFFVLTIAAERLELSRLAPTPRWAHRALVALAVFFAATAGASIALPGTSLRAFGAAMALIAAWQLRFDLARRTVRLTGLPRYSAAGVLLGAGWLLVTGVLVAVTDVPSAGPRYDAALHGVFVGYVLSMVFAHAPIVLPAVARVRLPFHAVLYVPLALLHVGLVARVLGDLAAVGALRQAGAVANGASLVVFAASVVYARRSG